MSTRPPPAGHFSLKGSKVQDDRAKQEDSEAVSVLNALYSLSQINTTGFRKRETSLQLNSKKAH